MLSSGDGLFQEPVLNTINNCIINLLYYYLVTVLSATSYALSIKCIH